METPKVIPFKAEHFLRMDFQEQQYWLKNLVEDDPIYGENFEQNGGTFSVECGKDIIFIGGYYEIHKGVAEVWLILSNDAIKRQGSFLTRSIREFLNMLQLKLKYHRLFTTVDMEFTSGHKWAKILGFHKEAILKQYRSNKADSALYVRLSW